MTELDHVWVTVDEFPRKRLVLSGWNNGPPGITHSIRLTIGDAEKLRADLAEGIRKIHRMQEEDHEERLGILRRRTKERG
ncbi:MAG: hypothetical protein GTN64_05630 [Candidatus Latescibacteria bacterium]|nr:hypothetical protein [Candidatus Latescibacterota bacterium]NIO78090.1 hypothetical protein [Candidatus Latescibacterota bacterium]